jgi:hypothetical protein
MSFAANAPRGIDLRDLATAIAPGEIRFDPLGLVTGYKAYTIYSALAAKSDAELTAMGVTRADLPGLAMAAAQDVKAA